MVAKRKTVSKLASTPSVAKQAVEEDTDLQIVPVEVEQKELSEHDLVAARAKELKSMGAGSMKELIASHGLTTGTKEVMIKALLKHEAKARAVAREQKSKIRAVVVNKKQELEGLPTSELSKLCDSMGMKGLRSKEERVQRLLVNWQENDGVDKALAQIAQDEKKQELDGLDNSKLQKLCEKIGVDPFVKEIMVDRISKREQETGCYSRPALPQETEPTKADKSGDMVDSLLANEAQRKKEKELKNQQEEVAAKKMKELKSMSVDELKKRLTKKGLEASGKKEDMLETLFVALMQEESANARQSDLKAKSLQDLKELLLRHGLESGSKESMIKALLAHEAKCRQELKVFEVKVGEVAEQKKKELETKSNTALKDMCQSRSLPVGGSKEERIERVVDEVRREGALDKLVSMNIRNKRKEELMSMDKTAMAKLCEQKGVDPFVKDIMVERIISHEGEDVAVMAMSDVEPAAKRARVSKK